MPNKVQFNAAYPSIKQSDRYYLRAMGIIPAATQTLAKGPGQYVKGIAPKYLKKGKGARVWDVDDNEYLDFNMGIGPISLGYCYDTVDKAILDQLENGITFSLMHPLEVELAETIKEIIPNAECVRFSKTGADITSAAIRLARAFTGRSKVLCCGYHGWHDWYISVTDRNTGIPQPIQELSYTFNYNDIKSVEDSLDNDTACVILEPAVFEEPKDDFLYKLQMLCEKNGSLLIFDEMWTGFRLALGGAQEYFGITPDLACYSKAVANGMPIGILTGSREVMSLLDKDVFFFTTFGGEALSLAAAKATIDELRAKNVPKFLAKQGKKIKEGFNSIAAEFNMDYLKCVGFSCRTMISFDPKLGNILEIKSLMQQELIKCGILWSGFHNMSFSHTDEDIEYTLCSYREILPILKDAIETKNVKRYLRGEPVEPVFRKTSNFNMKPKI
jgi:glutamate-1-semialdehyde 2,1-aminomutase